MKKEFDEMDERCNPQCMLNQEPGYVIYSAVGSFYAPMLVMMFFNWRIYQTAKKTTKAIRQGWTRVKGIKLQIQKKNIKEKAWRTFFLFGNMYIRVNTTLGSSLRSGILNNYDIFDTTCYFKLQLWT